MPHPDNSRRDAKIAELAATGKYTFVDIGKRFGVSREMARRIALKQGVTWPKGGHLVPWLSDLKLYEVHDMIRRGMPIKHASAAAGLCESSVYKGLRRLGLYEPQRDERNWVTAEERFVLRHYKAPGWSASIIGEKLGRTRDEVIGKAHRLGLTRPIDHSKTKVGRARAALRRNPDMTIPQLAKKLGISWAAAQNYRWSIRNSKLKEFPSPLPRPQSQQQ